MHHKSAEHLSLSWRETWLAMLAAQPTSLNHCTLTPKQFRIDNTVELLWAHTSPFSCSQFAVFYKQTGAVFVCTPGMSLLVYSRTPLIDLSSYEPDKFLFTDVHWCPVYWCSLFTSFSSLMFTGVLFTGVHCSQVSVHWCSLGSCLLVFTVHKFLFTDVRWCPVYWCSLFTSFCSLMFTGVLITGVHCSQVSVPWCSLGSCLLVFCLLVFTVHWCSVYWCSLFTSFCSLMSKTIQTV